MTAISQLMLTVVVDVANVMGARADGWWRDRAGAALRLCRDVTELASRGVPADRMPAGLPAPASWVLVLEGRARDAASSLTVGLPDVRVVVAPGSGDDAIVAEVAALSGAGSCLVVTADRELRRRCAVLGAAVAGPGWLITLLLAGSIQVTLTPASHDVVVPSAIDRNLMRMYVIVVVVVVVLVAGLLFLLDRALKAVQEGRRRRAAAARLAAAAAYAEERARQRRAAAEASSALTAVLPAIQQPEKGPRRVA